MLNNYYTLFHLVNEFQFLLGKIIIEVFTQSKDNLVIKFYDGKERFQTLQFSCLTNLEAIFLRNHFERSRSNSTDIFPQIIGERVTDISLVSPNRAIKMKLTKSEIYFFLFGGSKNNAYLVSQEGIIVQSFLKPKNYINKSISELFLVHEEASNLNVFDYISKHKFLGKVYAELVIKELGIDGNLLLKQLDKKFLENIESYLNTFITKLLNSNEYYVYFARNKYLLSLIPLPEIELIKSFRSISEGVLFTFVNNIKHTQNLNEIKSIESFLSKKIGFLKAKLEQINRNEQMQKQSELYKSYADLLISQSNLKTKGISTITLEDFDGKQVKIPLKPEYDLLENAQNYYEKAKRLREKLETQINRVDKIITELQQFENAYRELKSLKNPNEISDFKKRYRELMEEQEQKGRNVGDRFRKFQIGEDAFVYVGKNASNNDELTFGFAKTNDYWFHSRGVGGSHCVLKLSKGKMPSKELIERAAQIAAYFSKARNSKFVPVSYTQRKYVRKPKGAPAGTVLLEREEVIFVTPKIPDEGEE